MYLKYNYPSICKLHSPSGICLTGVLLGRQTGMLRIMRCLPGVYLPLGCPYKCLDLGCLSEMSSEVSV